MGTITIDGRKVEFTDEKNVLSIIRKAGIDIPTLLSLGAFHLWRLSSLYGGRQQRKDVRILL